MKNIVSKHHIKRALMLTGIVFISALFLNYTSDHYQNKMISKNNSGLSSRKFDYRYAGIVPTERGIMPLIGQLNKDGRKLYFTSQNMRGEKQLYVMSREKTGQSFGMPTPIRDINEQQGYDIIMPTIDGSESILIFVSSKDGTQRGNDLFIAEKTENGFTHIRALDEINDPVSSDSYPWISSDGLRLYFTKQKGRHVTFHMAERKSLNDRFGTPVTIELAVGETYNNMSCVLSADEKSIFILNGEKIYFATRKSIKDKFSVPEVIASSNSETGFMNGITLTDNGAELFVFNSVGFRNTQILKFENAVATPAIQKIADNKAFEPEE